MLKRYKEIYRQIELINDRIFGQEKNIAALEAEGKGRVEARIEHLKATLEKADDYMLRVKGFQELAKKSITSINVPTIEAPPGYRINLNRLRNWAMMIDPQAADDPFAQRVFAVAKCDECFLKQKKQEFQERIRELEADRRRGYASEIACMDGEISQLKQERESFVFGSEMGEFAKAVLHEHESCESSILAETFPQPENNRETFAPGCVSVPFELGDEGEKEVKEILGDYYLDKRKELLLPLGLSARKENLLLVDATPSHMPQIDRAVQNYILCQAEGSLIGSRRTYILDAIRFNTNAAGSLRQIEGSFALECIPRNPEQLTACLEQIVSEFGDVDDIIELYDSVREYNDATKNEQNLPLTTLILYGWPGAFSSVDRELLNRIFANYERYGISAIMVDVQAKERRENDQKDLPEYALFNAYHIEMSGDKSTVFIPEEGKKFDFKWHELEGEIKESYATSLRSNTSKVSSIGNDYTKRHDMSVIPNYVRGYRPINVPFGIDGKDQEVEISFDKNNFAAYLIGQSGSGKSTLIHTIIAGILRNYHPDDVELWLADFKQVEFKQYIDHMPPHVKYILLDESNELVYDLIDKLNDEMLARQQLLARLGKEKVEEIDIRELGKPVPIIFVILDEFSIMSQAIEEDQSYRLKLQNLLAKGRALGFKFLFASQKFTSGVSGLTPTAKDQIQQRISMKAPKDEINEVLALSPTLRTEKVRNWIDAIPPYYALVKRRVDDDTLEVNRTKVMYFSDNYESRDSFIDGINNKMKSVESLDYDDTSAYVEKEPVVVDGNSYEAYNRDSIGSIIDSEEKDKSDILLYLGTPRLMSKVKPLIISSESRENILIIARAAEQSCAASIVKTIIDEWHLQNGAVSIYAYAKNKVFKTHFEMSANERICVGMSDICKDIKRVKNCIHNKQNGKELVVLLGMDQICNDFEFAGDNASVWTKDSLVLNGSLEAKSEKDLKEVAVVQSQEALFRKQYDLDTLEEKWLSEGKSLEEIVKEEDIMFQEFLGSIEQSPDYIIFENEEYEKSSDNNPSVLKDIEDNSYNAEEDFKYLVRQGSRMGYHFLLVLNNYSDLRATGLQQELFRHKMAFQLSQDDSMNLLGSKIATSLPEHICEYSNGLENYSFRPFIHDTINWDGWHIDAEGKASIV